MSGIVHILFAVGTSLILALPPGSCCIARELAGGKRAKPAPAAMPSCCHHAAPEQPADSSPPVRPVIKCCCAHDATVPKKPVQPPANLELAAFSVVEQFILNLVHQPADVCVWTPLPPGPNLQTLLCVWRC